MNFLLAILEVRDIDRSLAFYRDLIGLPVIRQFISKEGDRIAMLGQEDQPHLELVCRQTPKDVVPGNGMAVSFEVEDALEIIRQNEKAFEGPVVTGPDMQFYFTQDPDGYRVQLQEKRS